MNSFEKFEHMLRLEKPTDRSEIPYLPQIITWAGKAAGYTQRELFEHPEKWLDAMDKTFELVGKPDSTYTNSPKTTVFMEGLKARIPGRELGDDELFQFVETDHFADEDEYDRILQMGYANWYARYLMSIQNPPFTSPDQLGAAFGEAIVDMSRAMKHFASRDVVPITATANMPVFDMLSMIHSLMPFSIDLITRPEKIMDVVNASTPGVIEQTLEAAKQTPFETIGLFPMRCSSTFISPDMFKEYAYPALKQMIEAFWAEGYTTVLHCDANWLPILPVFLDLPKSSVHFELDGVTDIFAAYEILQGWHSMRGDVGSVMLAFGTPDEVSDYCERLITELGMHGGFMLGSGCEVPLNAKLENVKAMADSLKK